jgi:hypothetical protein
MIIPKTTDVYVSIDVTHPQSSKDLNKVAIFAKGDQQGYQTYTDMDSLSADYNMNSSVYLTAQAVFGQANTPSALQVITYTDKAPTPAVQVSGQAVTDNNSSNDGKPTAGIARAAYDYFYGDWEVAIMADYNKDDALALSDVISNGGNDGKGFHFLLLQFGPSNSGDSSLFDQYARVFKFYHTIESEKYVAALAGEGATGVIGQVSWKFIHDLDGVTPETLSATEIANLTKQHLITYVQKADHACQTDDANAQGIYIDFIHGLDFVKSNVENNLQNTLILGGKAFTYDANGLNKIKECITSTLTKAGDQGIIKKDTTGKYVMDVNVPDISDISINDIEHRVLNNTRFNYAASSGVNKIKVNGSVAA